MLFGILLTLEALVAVGLVLVILLQRSEGGALGIGGGGGGFMTARGAGNLLTRTTGILATLFFLLAITLTILGNIDRGHTSVASKINLTGGTSQPAAKPGLPIQTTAPSSNPSPLQNLTLPGNPPASGKASTDPLAGLAPASAPQPTSNRKP
ncbi:MAG: preprotein translocase subunit SecG [Proteobacteria bacterium]|nr:preprotein translocase subunit SecG [Pseudomonadota bacterium]